MKTEETVSHRQNNAVKELGTRQSEAACALRQLLCGGKGQKDSVREAAVEEQLGSKTIHPAMRQSPSSCVVDDDDGDDDGDDVEFHVLGCRLTFLGQTVTNAELSSVALRPQKP